MVKTKARKVRKHMQSWGILHVVWSCAAFYAGTQYFFQWQKPYDEAMIGIAIFWFVVHYIAGQLSKPKHTIKK